MDETSSTDAGPKQALALWCLLISSKHALTRLFLGLLLFGILLVLGRPRVECLAYPTKYSHTFSLILTINF